MSKIIGSCPVCCATIGIVHLYLVKALNYTDTQIHDAHENHYKDMDMKKMDAWFDMVKKNREQPKKDE